MNKQAIKAMKSSTLRFFFYAACVVAETPVTGPGNDVSALYSTNEWSVAEYQVSVPGNSALSLADIGYTNLTSATLALSICENGDFLVKKIGEGEPFRIRIGLGAAPDAAKALMLSHFADCAALQPFPRLHPDSSPLGDIAFRGWGRGTTNSVCFVRNNVFVQVDSFDPEASVLPLAEWVDARILDASQPQ
ncbi:MAG: hypothetical protein IJ678_00410 [Kiritimatiellae bacterium]|nr:hypothetical protein [Kiritimatiellia bacterium]